jgi:hypothetical protein
MLRRIAHELIEHAPFTAIGAAVGIIIIVIMVFGGVPAHISRAIFYTLHPLHVVLSALTTTAMYRKHGKDKVWAAVLIGYTGSIGIATLSDAVIPYLGGVLLNIEIEFEVPFIEEWWLVNPAALIGIAIGYLKPTTKLPHSGHVLLSIGASALYFTAFGIAHWLPLLPFIFLFLFLAVWLPVCISDIVFPLLFTRGKLPPSEHIAYNHNHPGGK